GLLQRDKPLQQLHDGRHVRHPDILPNNPTKIKPAPNDRPDQLPNRKSSGLVEIPLQLVQPHHRPRCRRVGNLSDGLNIGWLSQPPLGQHRSNGFE
ncbi:hypothetical protein ACFQS1_37010, partial [Paractinoplanes rhizophilus]